MRLFWPIYLITAVVSTAGVYCFSPLARFYVSRYIVRDEANVPPLKANVWKKAHAAELNLSDNDSAITQWEKQKRPYQLMSSLAGLIY